MSSQAQTSLGAWAEMGAGRHSCSSQGRGGGRWAVLYHKGWAVQGTSLVEETVLAGRMGACECECAGGSSG